jgi:uncharacterized repeat protein (TIGR01451 family)
VFSSHSFKASNQSIVIHFWTVFLLLALTASVSAQNTPSQKLRGHIPAAVSKLTPLSLENSSDRLQLAIGLPLRNQDDLTNLLQQIYDPASPNFHRYLTPEEFTARFGPTEADYQAVIRYANQNGLIVTATHPNRVVVDVEAPVANIEKSFHVTMRNYQHPREARTFHAPDTEPTVDLAVPILHISGLDNYSLPHPKLKPRPSALTAKATPKWGSAPGGAYQGNDFRAAYSVGSLTGAGQSVGLLQFDGYYPADITNYESQAGLPNVTLVNVPVRGGVNTPGSGVGEVSLDIEMVMSMAPGISKIIVYEAPNPSPWVDLLSRMANDNLAKQLSCSWGGGPPDPTSEQVFLQMALQGQTFFNASGDSDAFTGAIDFPSESTNITQVGGTTLTTTGPGGSYTSETAWNWGDDEGTSGGVSTTYAIPTYQQGINMTANLGSTTMRNIPDVALTADDVYVVYGNGSTGVFGGTSCAAPLWAGFMALVNQQAAMGGRSPLGFINPAIYAIGKSNPNYTTLFHDVTTGNNFNSTSPNKFPAVAGYDLCTGWGTPNGTNLINALAPLVMSPVITAAGATLIAEGCLPTNGVIDSGETVTVNFSLQNTGPVNSTNLVVTLLATNGVAVPSGPQNYGALASGGSAVSRSFSFTAVAACGGTITPTFQLQDGAANLGTVTFSFPLGSLAATVTQNFDSVTAPALPTGWTTTHGGAQAAWKTTSSTSDSAPNSAFTVGAATIGSNALVSTSIALPAGTPGRLAFRNSYNLEASTLNDTTAYDGGVLEIKIGSGAFTDIESAGGTFLSGGYNRIVDATHSSPLSSRQVWSGNSGGFITTVVILPSAASGQTVQFRWVCGTDNSLASSGWYIDSIIVSNITCCASSVADIAAGDSVSPATVNLSSNVIFTLNVTNFGPSAAGSVAVADNLPAGLTFTTASVSQGTWSNNGNSFTASLGTIANGARATVTIQATAASAGQWTNSATISSGTTDTNVVNNFATALLTVNVANPSLVLSTIPDFTILEKSTLTFTNNASETGQSGPVLSYSLSNAPAGASIDENSGIFTWTPTEAQGPATNQIMLVVTDNSTPSISTAQSFNVTVLESNEPPVLAPVANRAIHAGMTLAVTNPATDPDLPANSLTFSLNSAPAGANINATNGVFSWTPNSSFVNTSNTVTVVVTDDNPWAVNQQHLSASNSFIIFVAPPPAFSAGTVSGGALTLTWSSISGQTYRVQYSTNLTGTNWTDFPPDVTANDVTASKTDSNLTNVQKFYRIMVLP